MCRLLAVKANSRFPLADHLQAFAQIARKSKEYQGHGWGCAYLADGGWKRYKNINPLWEDDLEQFGETTLLLAHARSAFRNEAIQIENNMPFQSGEMQFIFNGELHGVRLRQEGRIGAEKIFNFILRFHQEDLSSAIAKGAAIIRQKTRYVRAMNIIMSDGKKIYVSSAFNEDPEYFTLHVKSSEGGVIVCSAPYPDQADWHNIENNTGKVY